MYSNVAFEFHAGSAKSQLMRKRDEIFDQQNLEIDTN